MSVKRDISLILHEDQKITFNLWENRFLLTILQEEILTVVISGQKMARHRQIVPPLQTKWNLHGHIIYQDIF